jgi:hypothetical protein
MTIIENIANSILEGIAVDGPIASTLTNNTQVISNSRNGYIISSFLRKTGKDIHPLLGYAGAIIGGANKYYMVDMATSTPSNGNALAVEMFKGSVNQIIYQGMGDVVKLLPLSPTGRLIVDIGVGSIIAESSDSFFFGAIIDPLKKGEEFSFSSGCKKVATEGIMVGEVTTVAVGASIVGGNWGTKIGGAISGAIGFAVGNAIVGGNMGVIMGGTFAAPVGGAIGSVVGSLVVSTLVRELIGPIIKDSYEKYIADTLASFCPDPEQTSEQTSEQTRTELSICPDNTTPVTKWGEVGEQVSYCSGFSNSLPAVQEVSGDVLSDEL